MSLGKDCGNRQKEDEKNMEQLGMKYTRERRTEFLTEIPQLALADQYARMNHTNDWNGVRLTPNEPDWKKRSVKVAIFIRKVGTHGIQ